MVDWLEYTSEKIESEKEVLYRTRYSVDFSGKKKGELSGYISKIMKNLISIPAVESAKTQKS